MSAAPPGPGQGPRRPGIQYDIVAIVYCTAVLAFAVARAFLVPITHDEAFTFLHWSSAPWRAVISFDGPGPANNHLLNTILMKLSARLLDSGEASLRLPNLLALASYLASLWLLLRRHAPPVLALSGLVLASANRHLLELFSLARGYGLCLGLILPALLLASLTIEKADSPRRNEWLALSLLYFAVLSQFIALDVFAAMAVILVIVHAVRARDARSGPILLRRFGRRLVPLLVTSAALAMGLTGILWRIGKSGGFYAGGTTGLWHDTVENLVWLTLLPAPWLGRFEKPLLLFVAGSLVLVSWAGIRLLFRRQRSPSDLVALAFVSLLALTALTVKLQSLLLGLRYPTDRIATIFIPLFALAVTLGAATAPPAARKAATALLGGLALLGSIHLLRVADTNRSALWWFDADVRLVISDLDEYTRREGRTRPTRVGSISHCEPALNYIRVVEGLYWLAPVERLETDRWDYDLCYVTEAEATEAGRRGFSVLRRYPRTGNLLLLPPR